MAVLMTLLVIDGIWRSFYRSSWYAAALISLYLTLQILLMVWEAKLLLTVESVDAILPPPKRAICELTSIHLPFLDPPAAPPPDSQTMSPLN